MKAVIYARYSSHNQTEQSIEGQLRDNYAWAQQQGVTVVGEYIDRALSGTVDARPDFQRMIADAQKRQFEMVIVWKLDRFARNRYDSAVYKARLKKCGVRVVSVKENITDTPEGIILEGLLESMAEYYSANLAQNVRRGQRENAAKGLFCGGTLPYGYRSEGKKLVPDPHAAPIIRYVFEQYAAGIPRQQIIADLNARGYRDRRGRPFSKNAFQHALGNPVYIGRAAYMGETVDGLSQPIVDEEVFMKAQERLQKNARQPAANKAVIRYALQGKVFCGECGAPLNGESGRSHTGATYRYYKCSARKRGAPCRKKPERKEDLERYIVNETVQYVLDPDRARDIAHQVAARYQAEFTDAVAPMEKRLDEIDREMDRLLDLLLETPKQAHAKLNDRLAAIGTQKENIESDLSSIRAAAALHLTETDILALLAAVCDGDPEDEDYRARVIDTFISSIYVREDRVTIFYNLRNSTPITFADIKESEPPTEGSDTTSTGDPSAIKLEPRIIFIKGTFGMMFYR